MSIKLATVNIAAIAALSTSGQSAAVDVGEFVCHGRFILSFGAPGGASPRWDFVLEHSADGVSGWEVAASFPGITGFTAAGAHVLSVDMDRIQRFVRLKWSCTGTLPTILAGLMLVGTRQTMGLVTFAPTQWYLVQIDGSTTQFGVVLEEIPDTGGPAEAAVYAVVDTGSGPGAAIQLAGMTTRVVYPLPTVAGALTTVWLQIDNGQSPAPLTEPKQIRPWAAGAGPAPTAPAQMAAPTLTGGTGQATVAFAAAPADGGSPITSYGYQITLASDPTFAAPVATGSQATRADVTVTGLAAGSYIARTRAGNAVGNGAWSAASAAATVVAAGGSGFLGAAVQTFGNVAVSGTPLASNAPASRKLGLIGDSRVAGVASGQLGGEAASVSGEWVWIDHRTFNYGLGGSSIWHARNTQVPAALADGCKTFFVLTGHNGARQAGEGDGVDTLATRQAEILALLAALDAVGSTIFLANEMPGQTTGPGTTAIKVSYHAWLKTLTKAAAGLVNADLVIVDTWAAVADNAAEDTSTSIDPRWTSDGLHPGDQGTERMAYAIWYAMRGHFTQPHLAFAAPAQRLLDGTTTATINRGTVPSGWTDFTAADGLVYATSGAGANTVLTVTNTSGSAKTMALRRTPAAVTDGVLMVEYDLDYDAGVSRAIGTTARSYDNGHYARNFTMGSGANIAIYGMWGKDVSGTGQERELGGRRRVTTRLGPSSASPRIDLGFSIPAGMTVRVHAVNIYER